MTTISTTEVRDSLDQTVTSPAHRRQRAGLGVMFLVVFVDLLGFGLVLPLLPVYAEHLMQGYTVAAQGVMLGLLMTSFSLMQFLFSPFWGNLSDRLGRRPILLVGLAGSTFCYTLFGVACAWGSLFLMFVARIGAGIMGATISTAQAYIADVTPVDRRASGMAIIGAAFGLGFTFGPLLGALAMSLSAGQQAALSTLPGFMGAAFSGTAFLLAFLLLRESLPPAHRRRLSHSRVASEEPDRPQTDWHLLFSRNAWQEIVSNSALFLLLFSSFLIVFALSGFEATLSVTLADLWQLPGHSHAVSMSHQILWVFVLIGLTQTLTQGVLVRKLSLHLSETTLSFIGLSIAAIGFLAIAGVTHHTALRSLLPEFATKPQFAARVITVASCLVAAGMAFVIPGVQSLISRCVDASHQGRVFGVANSLSAVARIVGVLLAFQARVLIPGAPFLLAVGLIIVSAGLIRWAVVRSPSARELCPST